MSTLRTNGEFFICKKCLTHFTKKDLFEKHITYCQTNETVAVKMPPKNSFLKFQNHYKKLPVPFVVYADFECFTKPLNTCKPYPHDPYTYEYHKHEPSGFCLYIKGLDGIDKYFKLISYTKKSDDEDISKIFVNKLESLTHKIYKDFYKRPKPLKLSIQEQKDFKAAEICHICNKEFYEEDSDCKMIKVRDHCHFTGEYLIIHVIYNVNH